MNRRRRAWYVIETRRNRTHFRVGTRNIKDIAKKKTICAKPNRVIVFMRLLVKLPRLNIHLNLLQTN